MADPLYERLDRLQVQSLDSYSNDVGRGNIKGGYREWAYGLLTTTGASNRAIVRDQGGTVLYIPDVAGEQASIVSTSANDTANGTGIQQVIFEYLDGDLNTKLEVITLNGLTPVLTIATDIRWIQSAYLYRNGALKRAAGNIDMIINSNVMVRISTNAAISKSSLRRIPAGKQCLVGCMMAGSISGTADSQALIEFFTTAVDGLDMSEQGIIYSQLGFSLQDDTADITLSYPAFVTAGALIGFIVTADKSCTVSVKWMGAVERDNAS